MRLILVAVDETVGRDAALLRRHAAAIGGELARQQAEGLTLNGVLSSREATAKAMAVSLTGVLGLEGQATMEELSGAGERAWACIESIKGDSPPDANFVIVLRIAVVRSLVERALSMPADAGSRFEVSAGSLTVLEFRFQPQPRTLLTLLNETCHLDALVDASP